MAFATKREKARATRWGKLGGIGRLDGKKRRERLERATMR